MRTKSDGPFALDRYAESQHDAFYVLLGEAGGIVFNADRFYVRGNANAQNPIPAMDIRDSFGIGICQRPHEVVLDVYLGHEYRIARGYSDSELIFHRIWRSIPIQISVSWEESSRRRTSRRILSAVEEACT